MLRDDLDSLLGNALRGMRGDATEEEVAEFIFHFQDCAADLIAARELLTPGNLSQPEANEIINGLLYHAVGHLAQAARLYGSFLDPFNPANEPNDPSSTNHDDDTTTVS